MDEISPVVRQEPSDTYPYLEEEFEEESFFADPSIPQSLFHGSWALDKDMNEGVMPSNQDTNSIISFKSDSMRPTTHRLNTKVEMVYSLLSMLGTHDRDDMSKTLLAMSRSPDSCLAMRQSGCLPLLVQLLHSTDGSPMPDAGAKAARHRAMAALHSVIFAQPDDQRARREMRMLQMLEIVRLYCETLRDRLSRKAITDGDGNNNVGNVDEHKMGKAVAALMKHSYDADHRQAICALGGLQALAELLQFSHELSAYVINPLMLTIHRYVCMTLTNLTFGDGTNKAVLCSMRRAMRALVAQLRANDEELCQEAGSVLRNLSWRADATGKAVLRDIGAVTSLMQAAMHARKESTLKSVLSALWNLSAHCSENKADVCAVPGSLTFLTKCLTYDSPSNSHVVVESGGGILRNVSSHIAVREDYRQVLRDNGTLHILLNQLGSSNVAVVSNACGTLWNLSARCPEDQRTLCQLGAISLLKNLTTSKHRMIAVGSAAALKNLLAARPQMEDAGIADSNSLAVRTKNISPAQQQANMMSTGQPPVNSDYENFHARQNLPMTVRKPTTYNNGLAQSFNNARSGAIISSNNSMPEGFRPVWPSATSNMARSRTVDTFQVANDLSGDQDEPIDYSRKYGVQSSAPVVQGSSSAAMSRMAPTFPPGQMYPQFAKPTPTTNIGLNSMSASTKKPTGNVGQRSQQQQMYTPKLSRSHDMGTDQVTNFGAKFAENDDPDQAFVDQPINYSTRYKEAERSDAVRVARNMSSSAEELRNAMRRAREQDFQPDQLQTFCTEGTPMSFMSAAGSMENLRMVGVTLMRPQNTVNNGDSVGIMKGVDGQSSLHSQKIEAERLSTAGSGSQSNATGSTLVQRQPPNNYIMSDNVSRSAVLGQAQTSAANGGHSHMAPSSLPPALYSYNDSDATGSPNDKFRQYCTEDTPVSMSRFSSLSSLHSSEANEQQQLQAAVRHDVTLPSIDENKSLDMSSSAGGVKKAMSSGGSLIGKNVTFGESSVQETPLMFSRCSSLGSLNSCDMHSVHSSVISDYSRRTSEVVSPSDLPESPGDTMPSSPKTKHPPHLPRPAAAFPAAYKQQPGRPLPNNVPKLLPSTAGHAKYSLMPSDSAVDTPMKFMEEGSPYVGMSHATSLSALTIDSEPQMTPKNSEGKKASPGNEEGLSADSSVLANDSLTFDTTVLERTVVEKTPGSGPDSAVKTDSGVSSGPPVMPMLNDDNLLNDSLCDDDFGDSSSVSENEENMLAECINLAMPTAQVSRKMKRSTSDGLLKNKSVISPGSVASNKLTNAAGNSSSSKKSVDNRSPVKPDRQLVSKIPVTTGARRAINLSNNAVIGLSSVPVKNNVPMPSFDVEDNYGVDSPKKFAVEGTPINFSRTGSYGDLSVLGSTTGADNSNIRNGEVDGDSDFSLSDEDENLLEETIAAAMPKGSLSGNKAAKKLSQSPVGRNVEGSDMNGLKSNVSRVPTAAPSTGANKMVQQGHSPQSYEQQRQPRTATRQALPSMQQQQMSSTVRGTLPAQPQLQAYGKQYSQHQLVDGRYAVLSHQSMRQQPPMEQPDRPQSAGLQQRSVHSASPASATTRSQSARGFERTAVQEPVRNHQQYGANSNQHATLPAYAPISSGASDTTRVFEVEGTPLQFSRSDSLSSLSSCDDISSLHGFLADMPSQMKKLRGTVLIEKQSTPVAKATGNIMSHSTLADSDITPVRDPGLHPITRPSVQTPASPATATSLSKTLNADIRPLQSETSSLSMDSFSFETPSESLLEECITSAMPHHVAIGSGTSVLDSRDPPPSAHLLTQRTSPSGSSGPSSHHHSPLRTAAHRPDASLNEEEETCIDGDSNVSEANCSPVDSSRVLETASHSSGDACSKSSSQLTVISDLLRAEASEVSRRIADGTYDSDKLSAVDSIDLAQAQSSSLLTVDNSETVNASLTDDALDSHLNTSGHIEEHGSESTADDVSDSVSGCSVVEASHNASDVFAPTSPFASRSHTLPRAAVSRTRDVTLVSDGVTAGRPQVMDLIADSSKKSSDKSRKSAVKLPWRKNSSDDSKVDEEKQKKKEEKKKDKSHHFSLSLWPRKKKDKSANAGASDGVADLTSDLASKLTVGDSAVPTASKTPMKKSAGLQQQDTTKLDGGDVKVTTV